MSHNDINALKHCFRSFTHKLSSIFKNLLPIFILGVKLLQEPFAFICKKEEKHKRCVMKNKKQNVSQF